MKILITGSGGMLGSALCERLAKTHEIIGLDIEESQSQRVRESESQRVKESKFGKDIKKFYRASVTDLENLNEIFEKENPALVVHTAAWTDVDGCEMDPERAFLVNTTGTKNVALVSSKEEIPFVFISTDFIFDGMKEKPYVEEDTGAPVNVYGRSKWEAEVFIRENVPHYMVIRTSWLYGAGGENFVDTIIRKAVNENVLSVVNDQVGSPTYAKDLALAISGLIEAGDFSFKKTFHISNTGNCSWYAFAGKVLEYAGRSDILVKPISSSELSRPAVRPKFSVLDTSYFQMHSRQKMRPWGEALREYIHERL